MEHYQKGRFDEDERSARSLALQYPHDNFSWKILGAVLKQTDRKHDAVITGQKAVEINPQDVTAHNNLGNTLKELGRLEEAEASYTQAIALKADYTEAHNQLLDCLFLQDKKSVFFDELDYLINQDKVS